MINPYRKHAQSNSVVQSVKDMLKDQLGHYGVDFDSGSNWLFVYDRHSERLATIDISTLSDEGGAATLDVEMYETRGGHAKQTESYTLTKEDIESGSTNGCVTDILDFLFAEEFDKHYVRGKYVRAQVEEEEHFVFEDTPEESDIYISDAHGGGLHISTEGKVIGEVEDHDAADKFIREWAEQNKFWPNVWVVSDHGNLHQVAFDWGFEDIDEGAGEELSEDDPRVRAAIDEDIETLIEYFKEHPGKETREERKDLWLALTNLKLQRVKEDWGLLSDVEQWNGDDLYRLMFGIEDESL